VSEKNFNPASLSVLLVDDHDPIRKSLRRVIESMGFQNIFECTGGIDAIKLLGKNPIDLIISDLFMRQGSGFELLEFVRNREICADIPVLIVTGEASKEEIVKVADLGAEDYLLKPFQTNDFEKKVTRILNKYFSPSPLLQIQRRAERHFLEGHYKDALRDYDQAVTLDSQSPRTSHGKALT
jgi:two-component system chemotaxis response regulator CheY